MRIGIFAPYDLARAGGVNTHIRAQARALRARGHDVVVHGPASAPLENGEVALGRTTTVTFGGTESGLGLNPLDARRIGRLDRSRFDVVHVHEPLVPLVPWQVVRRARVPVVATFHVHRENGHRFYPAARPLLARLMRRIAYRIAVSDAARRTVEAHFPGAYDVVPNGIDVDAFRAPRARPASFATDRRHVLYVGRLEPRKGVDHLIRAMARVQQQTPAAQLVIVGEGADRVALETLAREAGADATFVGAVEDTELPAYFQASDLVCSPATGGESFGLVLLEAMACAKPVVASRIEGYAALVDGAACGELVPSGNVEALTEALTRLVADEARRRELGARGAEAARAYDWPALAGRLESIYVELARMPVAAGDTA